MDFESWEQNQVNENFEQSPEQSPSAKLLPNSHFDEFSVENELVTRQVFEWTLRIHSSFGKTSNKVEDMFDKLLRMFRERSSSDLQARKERFR